MQSFDMLESTSLTGHGPISVSLDIMTELDIPMIVDAIKRNLSDYREAGTVLAATLRRLENFKTTYGSDGTLFVVAKNRHTGLAIGGSGIGPLHGLSPFEGLGEIRDLYIEPQYRGQGIGSKLLRRCLTDATTMGYERLYLETTPQMEHAQKLFVRHGFRPITTGSPKLGQSENMPCYFILEKTQA